MQKQIITDHHIEGREALAVRTWGVAENSLSRISDDITRVGIHLSDESHHRSVHNNMRYVMEARLKGRPPIAVTLKTATLDKTVDGAADQLHRLIKNTLERLRDQKSHRTNPSPPGSNLME